MSAVMIEPTRLKERLFERLMAQASGRPADGALACMLASWTAGEGALPDWLGLGEDEFRVMLFTHFPGVDPQSLTQPGRTIPAERLWEVDDLTELLLHHCVGKRYSERWIARIVAAGCLGDDHLWQDLGLWSRGALSALLKSCFPELVARNARDMKWKKFLYRELCRSEGVSICRSPSCDACDDFARCFGPEE